MNFEFFLHIVNNMVKAPFVRKVPLRFSFLFLSEASEKCGLIAVFEEPL